MTSAADPTPRASCVRCNALLAIAAFEADWAYARCECGARSPLPETVRRLRPSSFEGGAPRAAADILAHRPESVHVTAGVERGALELRVVMRAASVWDLPAAVLRSLLAPGARDAGEPRFVRFELTLKARPRGTRWELSSSDPHVRDVVLDAPFRAEADGARIVVRGGHPVHEEWVAAILPSLAQAGWIAEWVGAMLHEHAERAPAIDAPRTPRGYRR